MYIERNSWLIVLPSVLRLRSLFLRASVYHHWWHCRRRRSCIPPEIIDNPMAKQPKRNCAERKNGLGFYALYFSGCCCCLSVAISAVLMITRTPEVYSKCKIYRISTTGRGTCTCVPVSVCIVEVGTWDNKTRTTPRLHRSNQFELNFVCCVLRVSCIYVSSESNKPFASETLETEIKTKSAALSTQLVSFWNDLYWVQLEYVFYAVFLSLCFIPSRTGYFHRDSLLMFDIFFLVVISRWALNEFSFQTHFYYSSFSQAF